MKKNNEYGDSLKNFVTEIAKVISFKENDGEEKAKKVNQLMSLEQSFRNGINSYAQSREMYKKFILMIVVENRNILTARPYFREKSKIFSKYITPAIKSGNIKELQKYHINYRLIKFIRDNWAGPFPKKQEEVFQKIHTIRNGLIQNNMPLVINRARLFFRKTPQGHLDLMDLIQIASEGLVSGVDKWVGPYSRVFNGVCIGRMTGNLIENYSDTVLHFYPSDRAILYRANSLKFRKEISDPDRLAEAINSSYEEDRKNGVGVPSKKIDGSELNSLMLAASPVSMWVSPDSENPDPVSPFSLNVIDNDPNLFVESMEEPFEENELMVRMLSAIGKLSIIEQKVLKLKGVKV